jgi:UDP-GlcNAc:undecaprenyl-phosphate GlcNAc-1-phosphate transferase
MNALLLSIVLISLMGRFSTLIGLVDVPVGRKRHNGHIPLVGAAVFVAFAVATLLLKHWPAGYTGFLLGLSLLVVLGVVDDLYDVRASIKLFAQTACAGLMVLPSAHFVRHVGFLPVDHLLPLQWAIPITILAMVGLINAINMMDGIDGLAGSLTLGSLFWFGIAASALGLDGEFSISILAAFCVIGFLGFNLRHPWRSRAGVFLGDAGSMMLGGVLGFLAIAVSQPGTGQGLSPVAVLWIFSIPATDTLSLAVRRLAAGRSPLSSDRLHLHHLMLDAGFSESQAVAALSVCAAVLGGIGTIGWLLGVSDGVMLVGLAAPVGLHIWFTSYGSKHLRVNWRAAALPDTASAPRSAEG